ncbi:MAG: hypothetical protein KTR14_01810 [Vampirovibrio sp.]|nr:hypothetical protein [Vampirovibrio sp.]
MNNTLFVANLNWSINEPYLMNIFSEIGLVRNIKIPVDRRTGRSRGFAFVEMDTPDEAQAAIDELHNTELEGRVIAVIFQDESRKRQVVSVPAEPNSKLFIRNVAPGVTQDELMALFQQAGQVESLNIPQDRQTGANRGFAFAQMATVDDARRAIEQLDGQELHGTTLSIGFSDPNRTKQQSAGAYVSSPRQQYVQGTPSLDNQSIVEKKVESVLDNTDDTSLAEQNVSSDLTGSQRSRYWDVVESSSYSQ